jgi:hypothetical protein
VPAKCRDWHSIGRGEATFQTGSKVSQPVFDNDNWSNPALHYCQV